jgi:hypothetical protein
MGRGSAAIKKEELRTGIKDRSSVWQAVYVGLLISRIRIFRTSRCETVRASQSYRKRGEDPSKVRVAGYSSRMSDLFPTWPVVPADDYGVLFASRVLLAGLLLPHMDFDSDIFVAESSNYPVAVQKTIFMV